MAEAQTTKHIYAKLEPVETRKELAKIAGTSHDTIAKVLNIIKYFSDPFWTGCGFSHLLRIKGAGN